MKRKPTQEEFVLAGAIALAVISVLTLKGSFLAILPIVLATGLALATLHVARNKRELAERSRQLENLRVNTDCMIESLSSGLVTIDADGVILFFNEAGREILGIDRMEWHGRKLREVFSEDQTAFAERLFDTYLTGRGRSRFELSFPKKSGETIPLGITTSILRDSVGTKRGVIAVFQDLAEVKVREAASRRKDRLAAMGELSAVVAHEIRNSLGPISGSVEILAGDSVFSGDQNRLLSVIFTETARLQRFVSEILQYGEDKPIRLEDVEVDILLKEAMLASMGQPNYCDGISIRVDCNPKGLVARVDSELIRSAILNLAINAFDAMETSGTLRIEASEVERVPDGSAPDEDAGCELLIKVEDDGRGMTGQEQKKALEPFFSTKRNGTGLGLAIVQKAAEQHGGSVEVESAGGIGTVVTLRIPQTRIERAVT